MKNIKSKFLTTCLNKCRKIGSSIGPSLVCDDCLWPCMSDESFSIPKDVPKGHIVVYVGEEQKRFVIKLTLLNHPLFKSLLDRAQDECDFKTNSKLWIPCSENLFHNVVCCANCPPDPRLSHCF